MSHENDLTLEGALRDPMIGLIRAADRVDAEAFESLLRTRGKQLAQTGFDGVRPARLCTFRGCTAERRAA